MQISFEAGGREGEGAGGGECCPYNLNIGVCFFLLKISYCVASNCFSVSTCPWREIAKVIVELDIVEGRNFHYLSSTSKSCKTVHQSGGGGEERSTIMIMIIVLPKIVLV